MNSNAPSYGGTPELYPLSDGCNTNNPNYGVDARDGLGQRVVGATALGYSSPVDARGYDGGQHGFADHLWRTPQPAHNAALPYTPSGSTDLNFDSSSGGFNTHSTGASSVWVAQGHSIAPYTMSDMTEQSSPTPAMLPDHARDFQRQRTAAGCFASSWRTPVSNGILVSPSSGGNTSSPWKNPVPCPNTVMEDSDNEPLELSEELKAHVDVHINYMLSIGEDPRTSRRARATLAQVLNVDASRIWHHLGQHFAPTIPAARSPAPCTSTVPSVVPFEKQPAYIQDIILAIVNDYVSKHSKPCIPGTFNPPAEDAYLCIWPDCDYSHRREAQWRRHVMLHRQQSVYVCCLCFNSNAKSDSIFRDYRKDKLLNHLTAHGLMKGDDRRERVAQASCQAVNDTYTSVCDRKQGNRACHFSSQSWSEHISHVAGHLKQEIAAAAARRSSGQSGASSGQEALDDVGAALQGARKRSSATSKRVTGGDTQASTRGRKKAKK